MLPPPILFPHLARPPFKRLRFLADTIIAPYLSLGRSCQSVCIGRRFNFTAVHPPHPNKPTGQPTSAISDHEWILRSGEFNPTPCRSPIHTTRTGRIVDTLSATLPNFFINGLTSQIIDSPSSLPLASLTGTSSNADRINCTDKDQEIHMYSPSICLEYTHPTALLAPLPQNLHVKGLSSLSHATTAS